MNIPKLNIYKKVLILFLLLSLPPLVILGTISHRTARQTLEKNIGHGLEEIARMTIADIDNIIDHHAKDIRNLAQQEIMQEALANDANHHIQNLLITLVKNNPEYYQASCLNQQGQIIASSDAELIGKNSSDKEFFQKSAKGKFYTSDISWQENLTGLEITLSAPIYAEQHSSHPIGVIYVALDWESIYPQLEKIKIAEESGKQKLSAHIMLINKDGLVIFAPGFERLPGIILHENLFKKGVVSPDLWSKNPSGYLLTTDEHNNLSLIGYAHSESSQTHDSRQWTALALQNVEYAFIPITNLKTLTILIFIILLILLTVTAHIFAKQLTENIYIITKTAQRIAQKAGQADGQFNESIQIEASDEIGDLAQAFNKMCTALQDGNQKLIESYHKLDASNQELRSTNESLEYTTQEIKKLLEAAVEKQSFDVRFHNPDMGKCWEINQCNNKQCPGYENPDQRCWQIVGTFCKGSVQGTFAQKLKNCQLCEVYQKALSTRLFAIGEIFNNMMTLLEEQHKQLQEHSQNLEQEVQERTGELKLANQELENEIQERKNIENNLRQEKNKVQLYLDIAGVMFVVLNPDKTVAMINKKGCEILGHSAEEIIGKNWFSNFIPPNISKDVETIFSKLITGEIKIVEYYKNPIMNKNKQERIISWHNSILKDEDGNIIGLLSSGEDITEQELAAKELLDSAETIKKITASAQDAIIIIDNEGNISFWNQAAEKILGYSSQEALGQKLHTLIAPQPYHAAYKEGFAKFKNTGEGAAVGKTLELRAIKKNGAESPIELSLAAVKLKDKWNAIGILRDITERKLKEEAIKRNNEMLENAYNELQNTNQELKETQAQLIQSGKLAAIGQLAAGVSHELNNPIGGILGYSQFILEKARRKNGLEHLSPEELTSVNTYIGYIEKESLRCKTIVSNLLKFSRSSKTEVISLAINQVIGETLALCQHQLKLKQVDIVLELAADLSPVMGNEHQLQQVFTNLIVNAQQAMEQGGKLTISTKLKSSDFIEITFADTGYGIRKEHMSKLFEPFFTTKPPGEGTGLGLSVSYGIIKAHNGDIEVESEEGKGTVFKITLPIKTPPQ